MSKRYIYSSHNDERRRLKNQPKLFTILRHFFFNFVVVVRSYVHLWRLITTCLGRYREETCISESSPTSICYRGGNCHKRYMEPANLVLACVVGFGQTPLILRRNQLWDIKWGWSWRCYCWSTKFWAFFIKTTIHKGFISSSTK